MALRDAIKEGLYISNSIYYLNDKLDLSYIYISPKILIDNESAIRLVENPKFHKRSKYISISYHFSRHVINKGKIELYKVLSKENLANGLTKNLSNPLHKH